MKWIPIESAPKDGSILLLAKILPTNSIPEFGVHAKPIHVWWATMGHWSHKWKNWNDGLEPSGLASPTHWMPLPPLPGSEPSQHAQAKAIMDEMTDDDRLSLMQEYCVHCGTKHKPCYCTRDD